MRIHWGAALAAAACFILGCAGAALAQDGFLQIDVPGSTSTTATGINNLNQIVGWYTTDTSSGTGFEYNDGAFLNVNIGVPGGSFTQPLAINDTGSIVGVYGAASGSEGFLLNGSGYSLVAGPSGSTAAEATGIDDYGDIAGWYQNTSGQTQGFLLSGSTGTYTTVAVPGASATEITGINSLGGVVTGIADLSTGEAGFFYFYGVPTPEYFSFALPPALTVNSMSINDLGEIGCTYADFSGLTHGCLSNGFTFSHVDDPNGIGTTSLAGLNDNGVAVGSFVDANGVTHGFVTTPEPSAAILLGSGLLALALAVARRHSKIT